MKKNAHCEICDITIWQGSKRCKSHATSFYIDGRSSKEYYCKSCKKPIGAKCALYSSGLCGSCALKTHPNNFEGKHHSNKTKEIIGLANSGEHNKNWKPIGYKMINVDGYVIMKIGDKKWQREHTYLVERFIGRKMSEREVIHHINGIKDDNRLINLFIFPDCGLHYHFETLIKNKILNRFILKSNLKQLKVAK